MKHWRHIFYGGVLAVFSIQTGILSDFFGELTPVQFNPSVTMAKSTDIEELKTEPIPEKKAPVVTNNTLIYPQKPTCADTATASNSVVIANICLNSAVINVGLNGKGEIDVPGSVVGMWGVNPGQAGVSLLDGHNPGIFSKLPSANGIISLNWGGVIYNYQIVSRETLSVSQLYTKWTQILYPGDGLDRLTLITCAYMNGASNGGRTLVYAVRV